MTYADQAYQDLEDFASSIKSAQEPNVSRRPQLESMIVGLDGCSIASRPLFHCEPQQLMSGAGVLITSICAGVTVTIISLYQKRKQWVDNFRALYAEFWNDKDIGQVHRWIVNDTLYNEILKPVLTQRIEKGYNDLDEDGSIKIDMVDKFMSLIIQLETLEQSARTKRQRTLIERFLFFKTLEEQSSLSSRTQGIYRNSLER